MEKLKLEKKFYIPKGEEEGRFFPCDIDGLTLPLYEIKNGHFKGSYLFEAEDGILICDDPETLKFNDAVVYIGEIEKIEDALGEGLKSFDLFVGRNIAKEFIDAYISVKSENYEVLKDVDMVQFSKYFGVLPKNVFSISGLETSVKSEAYKLLEKAVDKKTKNLETDERESLKTKARGELEALIEDNLKSESEPEDN